MSEPSATQPGPAGHVSAGQVIDGRYRLEAQLAVGERERERGGRGTTFRARHVDHNRVVALKLLAEPVLVDPWQRGQFSTELAISAALAHPNIAVVVDHGLHDGRSWIATEWLEGETLAERLTRGSLSLTAALGILRPLLAALASVHSARVLHRNLKPSNVFLERRAVQGRERVKLLDFAPEMQPRGRKRRVPVAVELASAFSPPELLAGKTLDARSDVFGVGATLIGMLSGSAFELAADKAQADGKLLNAHISVPARALPGVDAKLLAWMRRATAVEPRVRFPDAAYMLGELIDLLPRELRSVQDATTQRAGSTPPPPRPAPSTPIPYASLGSAGFSSFGGSDPAPVAPPNQARTGMLPPPPRMPAPPESTTLTFLLQSAAATDSELRPSPDGADSAPDAPSQPPLLASEPPRSKSSAPPASAPAPGKRARSGWGPRGTLWPIESRLHIVSADPWIRQPAAAAVFGLMIAGLMIFLQTRSHGRPSASAEEVPAASAASEPPPFARLRTTPEAPASAAAAVLAATSAIELAEEPVAPMAQPAAAKPDRPASTLPLSAAPGRPPVRDPWEEPMSSELKRLRQLALRGVPADEFKVKALRKYNHDNPADARGFLVIGQLYLNRLWRTDCVEEFALAIERDPTARGAPEILPTLLDMVAQGKGQVLAERLILKSYGGEALDAIELAFDDVKNPDAAERLHTLRLKITGGNPQ